MPVSLAAVEGERAGLERRFEELLKNPQDFDLEELERLVDTFRDRLSIDEILSLMARRVRRRQYADGLEQRVLLAIVEGRFDEVDRLFGVVERRDELGLRVISSPGQATPARSA